MAIYHCSISIVKRSEGRSAVAASAYRSGEKLVDQETGITHNYTRKKGIVKTGIMLCSNAPSEYMDREVLWNAVHSIEKAKNAQLAREIEVALPRELTLSQQIDIVKTYIKHQFVDQGMCADWAIHDKGDGNPHCHILLTMRPFKENGHWGVKERKDYALDHKGQRIPLLDPKTGKQKIDSRHCKQWKRVTVQANDWNRKDKAEQWRAAWADICNQYLVPEAQIDHRSYRRQGLDQEPTIHEGYVARKIQDAYESGKRAIPSQRVLENQEIQERNRVLQRVQTALKVVANKIKVFVERKECVLDERLDRLWGEFKPRGENAGNARSLPGGDLSAEGRSIEERLADLRSPATSGTMEIQREEIGDGGTGILLENVNATIRKFNAAVHDSDARIAADDRRRENQISDRQIRESQRTRIDEPDFVPKRSRGHGLSR